MIALHRPPASGYLTDTFVAHLAAREQRQIYKTPGV